MLDPRIVGTEHYARSPRRQQTLRAQGPKDIIAILAWRQSEVDKSGVAGSQISASLAAFFVAASHRQAGKAVPLKETIAVIKELLSERRRPPEQAFYMVGNIE
jgi:F0F1-type ATP synthase beta subunit